MVDLLIDETYMINRFYTKSQPSKLDSDYKYSDLPPIMKYVLVLLLENADWKTLLSVSSTSTC